LAHSLSAAKRARHALRRRLRNRSVRGAARTQVRDAFPLIAEGPPEAAEVAVRQAVRALDKAAQKGVIHPNNAARRKARLMRKYNVSLAAAAPVEEEAPKPKARGRRTKKQAEPKAVATKPKTRRRKTKDKE
jgi:small subunit ribosomal protein S20